MSWEGHTRRRSPKLLQQEGARPSLGPRPPALLRSPSGSERVRCPRRFRSPSSPVRSPPGHAGIPVACCRPARRARDVGAGPRAPPPSAHAPRGRDSAPLALAAPLNECTFQGSGVSGQRGRVTAQAPPPPRLCSRPRLSEPNLDSRWRAARARAAAGSWPAPAVGASDRLPRWLLWRPRRRGGAVAALRPWQGPGWA